MKLWLKWKIWRIESALKAILKKDNIKPIIWSFGAYYIDPKHMVFVVGVPTDEEKEQLKSDQKIKDEFKSLLETYNWPIGARDHVAFDIESQETIDRESNGNWWHHYK